MSDVYVVTRAGTVSSHVLSVWSRPDAALAARRYFTSKGLGAEDLIETAPDDSHIVGVAHGLYDGYVLVYRVSLDSEVARVAAVRAMTDTKGA